MRKRLVALIVIAGLLTPVTLGALRYEESSTASTVRLLIVRGESRSTIDDSVSAAWTASAREIGVPFAWISADSLITENPVAAVASDPAIVFPDATAQGLPDAVLGWTASYVAHGGHLLVVDDAGTLNQTGNVRPSDLFDSLLGISYSKSGGNQAAVTDGKVSYKDRAEAALWNVPTGKLTSGDVLSGYSYGPLTYPLAKARQASSDVDVVARSGQVPVLTTRRYGKGEAIWSALPLGQLCAYDTDAFPIDSVLQTVAFDLAGLPRILLAPDGGGGLVIDWHVESSADWSSIPAMERAGLLRPGVNQEFDISAGPDEKHARDELGFNACGTGRPELALLVRHGEAIGSDAGGIQDVFASQLEKALLTMPQIRDLVKANAACVTKVTGEPMMSYVGPDGVFPQPQMTKIIQKLGFIAYYYTGDSGAAPQLAFWNGKLTSSTVWAFPVAPDGELGALADMAKADVPASAVEAWLKSVATYAANEGTIQLIYSHPPDLTAAPGYTAAFGTFLTLVAQMQRKGQLVTESMSAYASFLKRREHAQIVVEMVKGGMQLTVTDPQGLEDIAVSAPSFWKLSSIAGVAEHGNIGDEKSYVLRTDTHQVVLRFSVTSSAGSSA